MALAGGLIFWALYQLFGRALLVALGGTGDVLGEAQRYAAIMFGGSAAIWLAAISSSIFRGMGDMKFPAMIMIIGALLQIPLSGALILGWFAAPQLGIAGAAVSVVLVSCLTSMILLARLRARLAFGGIEAPFAWTAFRLRVRYFKDILRVGLFSSLSPVLTVLAVLGVTGLVGRLGSAALAGYGIGSRLEFLS